MKPAKAFITALFILSSYLFCIAQRPYYTPAQQRELLIKAIDSSEYIFKGKVTEQKIFFGEDKHIPLTCSIIHITRIYKGADKIKRGTIKIITNQGGRVGNCEIRICDGPGGLGMGDTGTFLCMHTTPSPLDIHTDNDIQLVLTDAYDDPMYPGTDDPTQMKGVKKLH